MGDEQEGGEKEEFQEESRSKVVWKTSGTVAVKITTAEEGKRAETQEMEVEEGVKVKDWSEEVEDSEEMTVGETKVEEKVKSQECFKFKQGFAGCPFGEEKVGEVLYHME